MSVSVGIANRSRLAGALAAALALVLAGGIGSAEAQQISVAPRGGLAVAGGNFGQYLEEGPSFGLRIGYNLLPRTAIFLEGGMDQYGSRELVQATITGPGMDMLRFAVGVEQELVPPDEPSMQAWSLRARAGLGVAKIDSETFRYIGSNENLDFNVTAPLVSTGLSLGYTVGGLVTVFVEGGMNWARVDEDDTVPLQRLAPGYVKTFKSVWAFPYNLGIRIPFGG